MSVILELTVMRFDNEYIDHIVKSGIINDGYKMLNALLETGIDVNKIQMDQNTSLDIL